MSDPERFKLKPGQAEAIARALAEPRRVAMLRQVAAAREPTSCSALQACCGVTAATISHHVKELEQAGLVEIRREGKFAYPHFCREVFDAYLQQLAENFQPPPRSVAAASTVRYSSK